MISWGAWAAAGFLFLASANAGELQDAIAHRDVLKLEELSRNVGWAQWYGAGGKGADNQVRIIPELRLTIAGRQVALRRVKMLSIDEPDRHGAIG